MAILSVHELGHYFTARYYRAAVSLPYFIPAPLGFGTLGAIILMRSPARDRNSLFDIAAAGPLAGLAVAFPAILLGLAWSSVVPAPPDGYAQLDGGRIAYALFGRHHRAIGKATVTTLLLLGVASFLWSLRAAGGDVVSATASSVNWFVWAGLIFFLVGFHHTPPLDDLSPISRGRRVVGVVCLVLLVLMIPPFVIH